jgi:hypothetical protein
MAGPRVSAPGRLEHDLDEEVAPAAPAEIGHPQPIHAEQLVAVRAPRDPEAARPVQGGHPDLAPLPQRGVGDRDPAIEVVVSTVEGRVEGRELIDRADSWMTGRGVRNPARISNMDMPGFLA